MLLAAARRPTPRTARARRRCTAAPRSARRRAPGRCSAPARRSSATSGATRPSRRRVRGHVDCMKCLVLASKSHGETRRARPTSASRSPTLRRRASIGLDPLAYEDGTPYWYNPKTDESQWHEPGTAPPPEDAYARTSRFFARPRRGASAARRAGLLARRRGRAVDAAAPFETQRPPAFSPVDAAVGRGRRPSPVGRRPRAAAAAAAGPAVAAGRRQRRRRRRRAAALGGTRGRRCARARLRRRPGPAGGAADAAQLAHEPRPGPRCRRRHNSRTSLAEDEVQLRSRPLRRSSRATPSRTACARSSATSTSGSGSSRTPRRASSRGRAATRGR